MPAGATVAEVFLRQAAGRPGQAIVADAASGVRTYRDLVAGILALRGTLAALPGENVGIMLPASVGADLVYLAVLFAGKTPVMVNWTMGPHPLRHALDRAGVQRILTAEALVKRLEGQGVDLGPLGERFIFLERMRQALPLRVKLAAWLRARLSWRSLRNARIRPTAAILFTSGSETAPKAVPLTHANILTNIRDVTGVIAIRESDRLVGLLPPFHVFGLGETVILPLCLGLPTVYHPNPTDGAALTQIIKAYRATLLMGTPTFLGGIARAAAGPLPTLRLAVTGAEKCSERVYAQVAEVCPNARILEGYGITECSPIVAVNPAERPKPFTIGRALPSVEYAIVDDESRRRAAAGQAGMLLVRGPSIFGGYLAPAPTPHAALPQGFVEFEGRTWYRTGDLVSEDAEGYLTFCGRLKRFVKLGGEMVSLPAIEAALEPLDPAAGAQGPLLAVEATDDDPPEIVLFTALPLDRETVNRRLREAGLPPLYNVKKVLRLDAIPLLGSGKTDYRALKQMLSVAK